MQDENRKLKEDLKELAQQMQQFRHIHAKKLKEIEQLKQQVNFWKLEAKLFEEEKQALSKKLAAKTEEKEA